MFLFTIRFDATERRVKIGGGDFFIIDAAVHSSHLVLHCQPPKHTAVHSNSPLLQNDCNTVNCLHSWIVSGRRCEVRVTEPREIPTASPQSKYRRFISKLLHLLKGNVSLLLIKLLLSMWSSFSLLSMGELLRRLNKLNFERATRGLTGSTLSFCQFFVIYKRAGRRDGDKK